MFSPSTRLEKNEMGSFYFGIERYSLAPWKRRDDTRNGIFSLADSVWFGYYGYAKKYQEKYYFYKMTRQSP